MGFFQFVLKKKKKRKPLQLYFEVLLCVNSPDEYFNEVLYDFRQYF